MSADPSSAPELYRLSGGGNDFLALAEPDRAPGAERIRAWCTRGLSLGADGVFVLRRREGAVDMEYFNADGRPAELCLNGTRCAARLAFHLGWASDRVEIHTASGLVRAWPRDEHSVRLEIAAPAAPPERRAPEVDGVVREGFFVTVGVPVFVLPWQESLRHAPVTALGARLRAHPELGEAGANVMFTRFLPPDRLQIRSFERGVEAETLACGTGVLAACSVAWTQGLSAPLRVLTGGGCELDVDRELDPETGTERWSLAGDARLLGKLRPAAGAEHLPEPPAWA